MEEIDRQKVIDQVGLAKLTLSYHVITHPSLRGSLCQPLTNKGGVYCEKPDFSRPASEKDGIDLSGKMGGCCCLFNSEGPHSMRRLDDSHAAVERLLGLGLGLADVSFLGRPSKVMVFLFAPP